MAEDSGQEHGADHIRSVNSLANWSFAEWNNKW